MRLRLLIMALSNKDRQKLKDDGYVYHRSLRQWMKPEEIEAQENSMETVEQFQFYVCLAIAVGLLIWIFSGT